MMKKALYFLLDAISVLAIGAAVVALLSVVMTKSGNAPSIMGYSAMRVLTGSMEPSIRTNSFLITRETPASEIAVGDVISFYSADPELGGSINTHRVVAVEQGSAGYVFETRGDANALADKYPVLEANLVGRVVFSSYLLGVIVSFLATPAAFVLLIILPLAGMVIYNIYMIVKAARTAIAEQEAEAIRQAIDAAKAKQAQEAAAQPAAPAETLSHE